MGLSAMMIASFLTTYKMKIFLIFALIIILANIPVSICLAEEFSFTIKQNISLSVLPVIGAFVELRDYIIGDVSIRHLFEIPKIQRPDIFKAVDEINRSITETSTCL